MNRQWVAAVQSQNLDAIVDLYAPDGSLVWPEGEAVRGHDAIRAAWDDLFKNTKGLSLQFSPKHIEVSSSRDLASDFGVVDYADGNGRQTMKYLVVWRKTGRRGDWKVLYDSYNSNTKPPAPTEWKAVLTVTKV